LLVSQTVTLEIKRAGTFQLSDDSSNRSGVAIIPQDFPGCPWSYLFLFKESYRDQALDRRLTHIAIAGGSSEAQNLGVSAAEDVALRVDCDAERTPFVAPVLDKVREISVRIEHQYLTASGIYHADVSIRVQGERIGLVEPIGKNLLCARSGAFPFFQQAAGRAELDYPVSVQNEKYVSGSYRDIDWIVETGTRLKAPE
jgi:hypothetical protein